MLALDVGNYPGSWSADGQRIVFGSGDVEVMDRDGSNRQTLVADGRTNFSVSSSPPEQP
jgi:Tol biopolymer transport system component